MCFIPICQSSNMRAGPIMANGHLKMRCSRVSTSILYCRQMSSSTWNLIEEKVSHVFGAYKIFFLVERVALDERIARNCIVLLIRLWLLFLNSSIPINVHYCFKYLLLVKKQCYQSNYNNFSNCYIVMTRDVCIKYALT